MTVQLWMIDSQIDMRYFHGKSHARNMKLVTENKIRVKDEIPQDVLFLSQRVYDSHETVLGDKESPFIYKFLEVDKIMSSPIVRPKQKESVF